MTLLLLLYMMSPYNYPGTDTPVYNWDHGYFGNITIQYALQQSRNVTAKLKL